MKERIKIELIWWAITLVILAMIMAPIYYNVGDNYNFYIPNILAIIVFITFTRYIFLIKYSWFAYLTPAKIALIFIPIPLFIYFLDSLYDFQRFLDEDGVQSILGHLNVRSQSQLGKYIRYEKLFFIVAALITIFILPVRMILSIWRRRNRGTF